MDTTDWMLAVFQRTDDLMSVATAALLQDALLLAVLLGLLLLCGVRGSVLTSMTICMSTPAATATTMFAARHDGDTALSVELVSLSTLCSVLTMPVFIALAAQLGAI